MSQESSALPQGVIKKVKGRCLVLKGDDIDTDRIIPARFLKCVSFHALGSQVFADDRKELEGSHPFDLSFNQGASILIVNDNFGCGSSREHAPQALLRWGIRAIMGQSFAEIFYGNCLAIGIPCVTSSTKVIDEVQTYIANNNENIFELDLISQVFKNYTAKWDVNIQPGAREMLITGRWDVTSQLISQNEKITETMGRLPYLNKFSPK